MSPTYSPGRYTKVSNSPPPKAPGAYRHTSKKTGKVVRQGMTNNLHRRINEHKRSKAKYNSGHYELSFKKADGRSTSNTRGAHEKKKIAEHKPKFCKNKGGGGRVPK